MNQINQRYRQLMQNIFIHEYHTPDVTLIPMLSVIPAIRNGTTLLTGTYGTGKTTLINAYASRVFVDNGV
ncbi:MAG: hypothetical protein R8K22_05570 [Mariprofundaceae bacterium]